ncbi:MAG: co-chaperone GroES [Chloroflexota bacterium]|nr:co-chaperone GroES [Chloroflexota bacterium]
MAISIKPLDDRVVLEPIEQEAKTASGLVLPDSAKEKPQQGKVLAVASEVVAEISEGDVVLYAKYAGTEVEVDGKDVLILSEADLLAIVK